MLNNEHGNRSRRRRRGFTLMEVLLVMAILVMLGALVATNFMGIFAKSKKDAAAAQMLLFKTPLDTYQLHLGNYPATEVGLEALRVAPSDAMGQQKWSGPYLKADVPVDPWSGTYQYELTNDPATGTAAYKIWSNGPDQQSGTEDDVIVTSN
jgi:general secretion pathway protein G